MSAASPAVPAPRLTVAADASEIELRKHTQRFLRTMDAGDLIADQRRRKSKTMVLGWRASGSRETMMTFSYAHSEALGGRLIDLPVNGDLGLASVEAALEGIVREESTAGARL